MIPTNDVFSIESISRIPIRYLAEVMLVFSKGKGQPNASRPRTPIREIL